MPSAVNKGEHIFLLKFCWNQVPQAPTFVESPRQTEHFVVKKVFLGISGFLKGRGWGELQENHSSKKSFTWQFLVTFSGWLSDLQQGDEKVTLNHLAEVELIPLYNKQNSSITHASPSFHHFGHTQHLWTLTKFRPPKYICHRLCSDSRPTHREWCSFLDLAGWQKMIALWCWLGVRFWKTE